MPQADLAGEEAFVLQAALNMLSVQLQKEVATRQFLSCIFAYRFPNIFSPLISTHYAGRPDPDSGPPLDPDAASAHAREGASLVVRRGNSAVL